MRGSLNHSQKIAIAGVVAGIIAIALAIGLSVYSKHQEASSPAKPAAPAAAEQSNKPSFDVVRINPQGETVIAGRAMPKAEVVIL